MEKIRNCILPQGLTKAAYSMGAALLFFVLDLEVFSLLSLAFALFFLFAYRRGARISANISDSGICAPIDGRVTAIEDIDDESYGYRLTIESSWIDSSVLYTPFYAKSFTLKLQRGARLSKESRLFGTLGESLEALFQNGNKKVKIVHRLKRSPLRIEVLAQKKGHIECGENYGFAFDALTTMYLPKEFRLNIHVGQKIYASQNILGYFSS